MKNKIRFIAILLIAFALTLAGCGNTGGTTEEKVTITALQDKITLNVDEVLDYDYTSLFSITSGTSNIEVKNEYLDLSNLSNKKGTYFVLCTYKNQMASVYVEVTLNTKITINLTTDQSVEANNLTVFNIDYTKYFIITDTENNVSVKEEYLDLSNLRASEGSYKVICNYGGVSKELTVIVTEVEYQIKLNTPEVTIKQSLVNDYNFNQHFTVVVSGKIQEITSDMVEHNVTTNVGVYEYKVSLGETSMTLKVNVISDHDIEIINSYVLKEIEISDLDTFDFTSLFTVYIDNEVREVTLEMIDKSSLNNPTEDQIYDIKITYQEGQAVGYGSCKVKVIPTSEIVITPKNLVIYPNYGYIDLTTLFNITKKGINVPVTLDMISGSIDYAAIGINTIKLNYLGIESLAIVEVKQGVIINYANSNVIKISKGTSKSTYDFAKDFEVIVNGIKFTNIASYINTDNVDFNTIGSYTATISVPYTDSNLGIDKGTLFTKEITYEVVKSIYSISVIKETVTLKEGTTSYNPFDNLIVKVNGVNQKLTKIQSQASALATYAVILTEIDFTSIGIQEVDVDIYVNGPEEDPVKTTFKLLIESNIEISVNKTFVFEDETVYTKDIFSISLNGELLEISQDMIEGKIDTTKPGVYYVSLTYQGIKKEVNFIVLNKKMAGTYNTLLTTIPTSSSTDEEGYIEEGENSSSLKKLFITENGEISVNGSLAQILYGIDENTMYIKYNNYEFTLYYNNGIVVIDPNNDLEMTFIEDKRPLIYFDENKWELNEHVVINSTDNHILQAAHNGYSIDIFNVTNKETSESIWYALKIYLYEKLSSDVRYIVNHGKVSFDENFTLESGISSSLTYLGETYKFTMISETVGKTDKESSSSSYKYADKTFTKTINGETAILKTDSYEGFTLTIGSKVIFNIGGAAVRNQKYGGVDYVTNTVHIIFKGSNTESPYSYKFVLNLEDNSFEIIDKDQYFGRYESESAYIFFDGYGTGLINFDKKQYAETIFEYSNLGNLITMTYLNLLPSFEYGTEASVYIDEFNNTLTAKYFAKENLNSEIFVNKYITDGAVVNINSYELKLYSNAVLAKKAFFDGITIYTKDGAITDNATKMKLVNISDIDFVTKGIYHFSITVTVDGKSVVMHYSLQIV